MTQPLEQGVTQPLEQGRLGSNHICAQTGYHQFYNGKDNSGEEYHERKYNIQPKPTSNSEFSERNFNDILS